MEDRLWPTQVATLVNVVSISAGGRYQGGAHTCALLVDGTAWCWGADGNAQTGHWTDARGTPSPLQVPNLPLCTAVLAGGEHSCALDSERIVWCWGGNSRYQLGNDSTRDCADPVLALGMNNVIAISAGELHSCAIKHDGTPWCWGSDWHAELGDGDPGQPHTNLDLIPREVVDIREVVSIAAGGTHSCAVLLDGSAWCWGYNSDGQLGVAGYSEFSRPVQVPGVSNAVSVAAGFYHTCVVTDEATCWCWGRNQEGQLGDGSDVGRHVPGQVMQLTGVVSLTAGEKYTCAVDDDGLAWCWGDNEGGQLGNGTTTGSATPVQVIGL